MEAIPNWVYAAVAVFLIGSTLIVAIRNEGGVKKPVQLLVFTLITISYLFSLTFIHDVRPLLGLDLKGGVSVVLEAKGNPTDEELDVAVDVIRSRVDALGVAEPDISRQGNNIVVDLPGVKDARKAQELIGQTAELRFREVVADLSNPQLQGTQEQSQVLQTVFQNSQEKDKKESNSKSSTTTTTKPKDSAGPENSNQTITLQCGGTSPTTVTLTGDLTKPTPRENDVADKPIIALNKEGAPAILCPAVLKGDIVKSAQRSVDSTTGEVSVGVELTSEGGQQFTNLIGKPLSGRSVAIVLDSVIISAPTIQPDLADGLRDNQLQITVGQENQSEEVDNLVTVLRYGKLPVVLEQQTAQKVSPTLGTDQLRAGIFAGLVGLLLVVVYMIIYYRILALVVVAGIGLSGVTIFSLISWLGETRGLTLSLSGAVGLIVSLGVTVDSYVVYFEKLKDEVKQGRSIRSSLDTGFKASFKTILAADLVSLIGATVLFYLASGSVRGFAFFLGLSTLLDLIISVCFMHPMVKLIARKPKLITLRWFGLAAALDKKELTA